MLTSCTGSGMPSARRDVMWRAPRPDVGGCRVERSTLPEQGGRMTPAHRTSGTERRVARTLAGESPVFRLADEVRELRQDLGRATGGRSGKTLAKAGGLRVRTDGDEWELAPGDLVALGHNLRQPVRAIERSAFLVTVAWPEGAGAWGQEASSGHL